MDIVAEKTVICTRDTQDATRFLVLLELNGVSLNIDSGYVNPTSTQFVIDGVNYLPMQSSIEVARVDGGVSLVTTVAVAAK